MSLAPLVGGGDVVKDGHIHEETVSNDLLIFLSGLITASLRSALSWTSKPYSDYIVKSKTGIHGPEAYEGIHEPLNRSEFSKGDPTPPSIYSLFFRKN